MTTSKIEPTGMKYLLETEKIKIIQHTPDIEVPKGLKNYDSNNILLL